MPRNMKTEIRPSSVLPRDTGLPSKGHMLSVPFGFVARCMYFFWGLAEEDCVLSLLERLDLDQMFYGS